MVMIIQSELCHIEQNRIIAKAIGNDGGTSPPTDDVCVAAGSCSAGDENGDGGEVDEDGFFLVPKVVD